MGLSTFPTDMSAAAAAVLAAAEKFRAIRDQGGDLTWRLLEDAQASLRPAKVASLKALAEGQKQPVSAEAFMAQMGGPATLADFQTSLGAVEMAASAWNDALAAYLQTLPASVLIGMASIDTGLPTETRVITRPAFIPGAQAAPLRSATELNDLILAFEAVGA